MQRPAVEHWGRTGYAEALARQLTMWRDRVAGEIDDTVVEVEHPPTITLGRHAPESDVVMAAGELSRRGINVVRSDRGGRATVHGPGQVVVYPIVGVFERGLGVRRWVCELESALLETIEGYGIQAWRIDGKPGIWAASGKIASIGLRIARGVSYHGVALNTGLDAGPFDCIVPCGVSGERITSISGELGDDASRADVAHRLCGAIVRRVESYPARDRN